MKFTIGDVLYTQRKYSKEHSIIIITDITSTRTINTLYDCYHVKVLYGDYFDWFMDDSPIAKDCELIVSNLNYEEQVAVML